MRVQIQRVSDWRDQHGKGPIIIEAYEPGRYFERYVFRTFDPWKASVCERAQQLGALVDLTYRVRTGSHAKSYRMLDEVSLVTEPAVVEQTR